LKSYTWLGGSSGRAGLIRVAGAALASATAFGGTSRPLGGATTGAFPGDPEGSFGVGTGTGVGDEGVVGTARGGGAGVSGTGSGGASGVDTGTLLGGGWAGRAGAAL
jgi:hypothetical protein